jgi:hypothetical protein
MSAAKPPVAIFIVLSDQAVSLALRPDDQSLEALDVRELFSVGFGQNAVGGEPSLRKLGANPGLSGCFLHRFVHEALCHFGGR